MSEHFDESESIPHSEHAVSPLKVSFVFITLLIGTAITVAAAKLKIGIFRPAL